MFIGIMGPAGSGKSTLAACLKCLIGEADVIPFAEPVKDVARLMGWNGKKDEKGRRLLQILGTECGRDCIGEDIWVDAWAKKAGPVSNAGGVAIADDVRFRNEADRILANGRLVRIIGRRAAPTEHRSEVTIKFATLFENDIIEFDNSGELGGILEFAQSFVGHFSEMGAPS